MFLSGGKGGRKQTFLSTLVDTRALQGNYINKTAFEAVSKLGVVCRDISIRVCAAFSDCQIAGNSVELMLEFNVNNKLKSFSALLSFSVLENLKYELIIGRRDINKYDLWNKALLLTDKPSKRNSVHTNESIPSTKQSKMIAPESSRKRDYN